MQGRWLSLGLLALSACGPKEVRYDNSLLELGSGFAAKEVCTCVFVAGHEKTFCKELVRVKPNVARFRIDRADQEVRARALGLAPKTARYQGPGLGCALEPKD